MRIFPQLLKNKIKLRILFLTLFIAFLCGCGGLSKSAPVIDYYTLEYPPPNATDEMPLAAILKVDRLSVSPIYRKQKLIYKDEIYKRNPYVYHQWLSFPGEMIAHFIARDFAMSKRFQGVFHPEVVGKTKYRIKGNVEEILEIDTPSGWEAQLSLHIILIDETQHDMTKRVLFQNFYTSKMNCEKKTPKAFVKALSLCLQEISQKLLMDSHSAVSQNEAL